MTSAFGIDHEVSKGLLKLPKAKPKSIFANTEKDRAAFPLSRRKGDVRKSAFDVEHEFSKGVNISPKLTKLQQIRAANSDSLDHLSTPRAYKKMSPHAKETGFEALHRDVYYGISNRNKLSVRNGPVVPRRWR